MRHSTPAIIAIAAALSTAAVSHAATYYLKTTLSAANDWNAVGNYSLTTDGTGASPSGSLAGHSTIFFGRTVNTSSNATTYGGASLTLEGGTLGLRNNGAKTIGNLIVGAGTGTINFTDTTTASLVITSATATSGSLLKLGDSTGVTGSAVSHSASIGTLTGTGDLTVSATTGVNPGGSKTVVLSITDASGYTGDIDLTQGTNLAYLQFGNGLSSGGGLIASTATSRITLNQDVTFNGLTINGTPLAAGTYAYSALNASYDAIFTNGGSGSITVVPEPSIAGLGLAMLAPIFFRRSRIAR